MVHKQDCWKSYTFFCTIWILILLCFRFFLSKIIEIMSFADIIYADTMPQEVFLNSGDKDCFQVVLYKLGLPLSYIK